METQEMLQKVRNQNSYIKSQNVTTRDRDWRWREPKFNISPTRLKANSGYYGSYAMDNLNLSLHILYNSQNMEEVFKKCVNYGGDCDSYGAVALMLAGAYYGVQKWMIDLYKEELKINS